MHVRIMTEASADSIVLTLCIHCSCRFATYLQLFLHSKVWRRNQQVTVRYFLKKETK